MACDFAAKLKCHNTDISMAVLQSYFMLYRDSAQNACSNTPVLRRGLDDSIPVQQHMSEAAVAATERQRCAKSSCPPHSAK